MTYINEPWWACEDRQAHKELISFTKQMRNQQSTRYDIFERYIGVYEYGYANSASYGRGLRDFDETQLTMNAAQNIIDTMHCAIYSSPVVPMAITQGGDYSQRKRARMLNRALEGVYNECNVLLAESDAGLDALLCGNGIIKVWAEDETIRVARVDPRNIMVDEAEGRNGTPRCMYQRDVIDRFVCAELYPEHKDIIMKAPVATGGDYVLEFNKDQIEIVEAWHLPSSEEAKDGKHVICIEGATLVDEEWTKPKFPFAINRPKKPRSGWWGLAIMRQLMAGQYEYEKVTLRLSQQHELFGTTQLLVHKGAKVSTRKTTNEVGRVIEWEGNVPPTEFTPSPANPQSYQYRQSLPTEMAQFVGTNEFAVQQQVPQGLSGASGKALQVFKDEGSKRYATFFKAREDCSLALSELILDTVKELMKNNGGLSVRFATRNGYEQITWHDVLGKEEDEKSFILKIFPVSALSQDPSAKFQQLDTLLNTGAIDVDQFKKLFNIPDLDAENEIDAADTDIIDWSLDHMVDTGEYVAPQSFDNLELALKRAGKFVNMCRKNNVSDDRISLIHDYIVDVQALMEPPAPPAPPPGMMPPPGMPMGMPPVDPMASPMGDPGMPPEAPMPAPPMQ
jgi:hypothetical protein